MTGVGCAPLAATRSCQASCSSGGDAHATWWTVPAPGIPGSAGGSSYAYQEPRFAPRTSHVVSPVGSKASVSSRKLLARLRRRRMRGRRRSPAARARRGISDGRRSAARRPSRLTAISRPRPSGSSKRRLLPSRSTCTFSLASRSAQKSSASSEATRKTIVCTIPRPALPAARVRVLEERQVTSGAPLFVRVEEVVDGRVVLVHRLLDEPEAEHAHVEVDVARRVGGDARDVVDSLELIAAWTVPRRS